MPSISFYFQPFPSRVYLDFARGALWFCCIRICCPSSVFDRVAQVCKTCAIFGCCVVSSCLYLRVCERMIDGTVKSEDFTRIGFLNGISVFEGVCACWCVPNLVLYLLPFLSWNFEWLERAAGSQAIPWCTSQDDDFRRYEASNGTPISSIPAAVPSSTPDSAKWRQHTSNTSQASFIDVERKRNSPRKQRAADPWSHRC